MEYLSKVHASLPSLADFNAAEWTPVAARWTYGLGGLAAYLLLVRLLRYRRRDAMTRKYNYPTRSAMAAMTIEEATAINRQIIHLEFPIVYNKSLFFALFKTYGIPSISKLLAATTQVSSDATACKRAVDTEVLIDEMILQTPTSPRTIDSIARVNFLHERYRKSGKILDSDMLFTLGLFAMEPIRWISRYEWRELTLLERYAIGAFWKDLGTAMEIPYDVLKPYYEGSQYDDGLTWLEALDRWSQDYEKEHMVPAETNKLLADGTLNILFFNIPVVLRGFALNFIMPLLSPRLRKSMLIRQPYPAIFDHLLPSILAIRRLTLKYLCLPRPDFLKVMYITDEVDPATGRYHANYYIAHPWYVKPTFWSRWGPEALVTRLVGGVVPGDEGARYCPAGYSIPELGPTYQRGKGEKEMAETKAKVRVMRGCPMAGL
ncbi:hypothetical protein B0T22DRAFT_470839 [Podospora appendiculata]|uniref:ER-bound oxygenase mpaB/mpaB'/Rubber oxygenase catalytic domain-containing protein n=1 Tax=Podospora appendiculata TaxID=314037 RepID=A0AAE0X0R5_9PEZI|nr:hypothetical protein B0T22DRAFT_470839 [Podospora appendiculata]